MELVFDGEAIPFEEGDSVLVAQIRSGRFPAGSLCGAGDCGNCLVTVAGVSYRRACQTRSVPGLVVDPHPDDGEPPMPRRETGVRVSVARRWTSTAAIHDDHDDGIGGEGGEHRVARSEVVGIYPGPQVVAEIDGCLTTIDADHLVVETGRLDIHPVCEGNRLAGILTPSGARALLAAGLDLGRVVSVGPPVHGLEQTAVTGSLVRFEGDTRVERVVVESDGALEIYDCDLVVVNLGNVPRDLLLRMASGEAEGRGTVSEPADLPGPPTNGVVCPCSNVTTADLRSVADRGFLELELLKRATLAGTGACQGAVCLPHLRSFVADRTGHAPPSPFTARPLARPITMAQAAAGWARPIFRRTSLHRAHLEAGAVMDRFGAWWRPWHYGNVEDEYWAVRRGVSIGDVSTLGKMIVAGPDAASFLDRIYPVAVGSLSPGRSRYVLVLNEAGYVMDDGLVAAEDGRFHLTFTTGGAATAEAWLRDWAETWDADVRILDRTHALGAINVTGPLATELLQRLGVDDAPSFMRHGRFDVAGVPCHVFRLSFTGEVSYELHHPVDRSPELWRALMFAGESLGIRPHGLDALFTLRLEKGHVLIGMDTEPDSTPRRLGMEWAADTERDDFVGRDALRRTERLGLDRKLIGLTIGGPAPPEGAVIRLHGDVAGHVASSRWSPTLGHTVMLGWVPVSNGLPSVVEIDGHGEALVTDVPFYDQTGERARA